MGIVFRQSVKTSLVVFLGAFLGAFVIWLSTNYIGKQQLGFVRLLTNYAVVATQLLLVGLPSTLTVYIHKYSTDRSKRASLIGFCFSLPILIAVFASLFYFLLKSKITPFFQPQDIPYIVRYFAWLPIYTVLTIAHITLEQYLITQVKIALSSFVREVILRVCNICLILLFGFNIIDFGAFIGCTVLIYVIPVAINLAIALRTSAFAFSLKIKAFSKSEIRELLQFTWYHTLLSVSITLMGFLDTIMLATLDKKGVALVAIYGNAIFFVSVLQMPYKAMVSATYPIIAAAYKDKDMGKVNNLYVRSSLNMFIGTIFMVILVYCNIDNATALMPAGYEIIKPLFAILAIGVIADISTGVNSQLVSLSKYFRFNFYISIVLALAIIGLNLLLIPKIGVFGAACTNSVALLMFNIGKYLFVWRKLDLQPFSKNTILVLVAGLPAFLVGYYLPHFFNSGQHTYLNVFIDVVIRSIAIVVIYLGMLLWLKPSVDMQEYIASIKANKKFF